MSGRSFKLKPKVLSEEEKLSRYKYKLETLVESQESSAAALTKQVLQSRLLSEKDLAVEEMRDLLELGTNLRAVSDQESEISAGRNLRNIEVVSQLEMRVCQAELKGVSQKARTSKEMLVRTVPHTDFPHLVLQMVMLTEEDTKTQGAMPTIKRLEATLEGIEIDRNLREAISYCEKALEPQLLTELVREYLPLDQQRKDILDSLDSEYSNIKSDNANVVEFSNTRGTHLASIILKIKLSPALLAFSPQWQCKLTQEGEAACARLNIPSELATTGSLETWDWSQAVNNLTKVARFDGEDTPSKEFNASKVNTDTPICGARKTLTKRKL